MIDVATADAFETEVLQSKQPVLVDFWAPWCAPCKALAPTLEKVAEQYADQIKVVKVNVDDSAIGAKYGVRGIPTLILFKDGQPVQTNVGNITQPKLNSMVESHL
jgi:thioredoxin 1